MVKKEKFVCKISIIIIFDLLKIRIGRARTTKI